MTVGCGAANLLRERGLSQCSGRFLERFTGPGPLAWCTKVMRADCTREGGEWDYAYVRGFVACDGESWFAGAYLINYGTFFSSKGAGKPDKCATLHEAVERYDSLFGKDGSLRRAGYELRRP